MSTPVKHLRMKYPTSDRFIQDFFLIKEGRLFLPGATGSAGAAVEVDVHVPGLEGCYTISGRVAMAIDAATAKSQNRLAGIWIDFSGSSIKVLAQLDLALRGHDEYRQKLNLPAPPEIRSAPPPAPAPAPKPKPPPAPAPGKPAPVSSGFAGLVEIVTDTAPEDRTCVGSGDSARQGHDHPDEEAIPLGAADDDEDDAASDEVMDELEDVIGDEEEPVPTVTMGAGPVEIDRLREMISAGERGDDEAPPVMTVAPPVAEKKDLSAEERERLAPVGEFIMDLVKAMLRSGYYDPDHPQSRTAKTGLYEQLKASLAEAREIMITHQDTREKSDVLISGIIEDQVSVRTVIGAGMAELFIPRLKDYFERKGLVSFAVKNDISQDHFEAFVDVMSDPKADRGVSDKVGSLLTQSLVDRGITEISAVFIDDALLLEDRLPWRVQMAINRLAKDIKVLPLFKGLPPEEIHRMKVRIVEDIIRPLRHPLLLRDIVLNCYVIARHVEDLDEEELERTVIDCFPLSMLLSTSGFILEELGRIKEQRELHPDNPVVLRRHQGVMRVLKWVSHRVIAADAPGAREFLLAMYFNQIIPFNELPAVVQYHINTLKLTDEVTQNVGAYVDQLIAARTGDDARVLLACFLRVVPVMIEKGEWAALAPLARGLDRSGRDNPVFRQGPEDLREPLARVFADQFDPLVEAYQRTEKTDQPLIDEIAALLGPFGIELLIQVMAVSESRGVRKYAVEALVKMGAPVAVKVRELLDDSSQFWYLHRNAILILGMVGQGEDDLKRVKKYFRHPHPRLREETLNAVVRLEGKDAEKSLITALDDADLRVVRRALANLSQIQPVSEPGMTSILARILSVPAEDKEPSKDHEARLAHIIRAVGAMPDPVHPAGVETALLEAAGRRWKKKGGWLKRLRRTIEDEEDPVVLLALVEALGKLSGPGAVSFLESVASDDSPLGRKAREALDRIQIRTGT